MNQMTNKLSNILFKVLNKKFNFIEDVKFERDQYLTDHIKVIVTIDPIQFKNEIFPNLKLDNNFLNNNKRFGHLEEMFADIFEPYNYCDSLESLIVKLSEPLAPKITYVLYAHQ